MDKDNRFREWRQASQERSEIIDRRLHDFLKPVADEIGRHLDLRLMQTWIRLIKVIFVHRHRNEGGWMSVLGSYLLPPMQAEAGRKRVTRLIHSDDWDVGPIESFLWQQADRRIRELEAQGSDSWLVWDESAIEKAESQKAEGLMPVRSSKASRLTRHTPMAGKPVFVNGVPWVQLIITGMKGHWTLAQMCWWSQQGPQANHQRGVEQRLLTEMSFRCNKSEFAFESPRLHQWEHRSKLLALLTLAYAFLLSLWDLPDQELRHWLLDNWCHRTGKHNREVSAPLYRLRQAIQRLWLAFPPSGLPLLNTG